jgi:galactoside O-acetyltransferase
VFTRAKGLPYYYDDPAIMRNQLEYQEKRQEILKKMFAEIGEGCHIEMPLHANWSGHHVHFGRGIYCNSNLTLVDDGHIYIGDYCMIASNMVIAASGHPILPVLRENHYVYNLPVRIGRNVWIGSGIQILPSELKV